jgi:TonB family protein
MTPANAVGWFAQIAMVVLACAGLPRLLGLRSAVIQHVFWRAVLAVCLLLPMVEPRQPGEMVFVPAPAGVAAPVTTGPPRPASSGPPPAATIDWTRLAAVVIGTGIALRLAWLAAGLTRLRRLRFSGVEPAHGFEDLRQAIGVRDVSIGWSSAAPHPVTFGVRRPVILLPVAIKAVDAAAQRAVVAHELHHVERRDWLWTIAEEIVRAVFWFHPAMWWLISRVQLARETVVDELSILTTNARRAYLDTLMAFADDTGLQSSPAFSARRHLFHRVMLLSKEGTMSSTRVAIASCLLALGLTAGTWKAVSAFPLYAEASAPEQHPMPPPLPQTPETYHIVATYYYEIVTKDAALTPAEKRDTILKGIAAEDRALGIDPNYVPALVYKNIFLRLQANLTANPSEQERLIVEADALRQTAISLGGIGTGTVIPDGTTPPPPPPPPPPMRGDVMVFAPHGAEVQRMTADPVRVGGNVQAPMKIRDVRPVYPPIAREAGVQGTVVVEVLIDSAGYVAQGHILRSIPLLDQAALEAVRQWRFTPTVIGGEPRPVLMTATVNFTVQ